jgi:chromate transporter
MGMTPIDSSPGGGTITLTALFTKFLRFGMLAFGGPVAQIAMLRETLVDREGWIDAPRFNRLLAVMQALPGPEAHELAVHMGMIARGRIGGLLAGLGFMLPGFVLMLAGAWAYTRWLAGLGAVADMLLAVQIAVLAIILRAVVRIGEHMIAGIALALIALAALGATILAIPFWIPLLAGGIAYALSTRSGLVGLILAAILIAAAWGGGWSLSGPAPAGDVAGRATDAASTAALFIAGLKGGLLTFGGAYTAIPYVRADTVGRGWISDAQFLDGIALAGVLPAPLVIFATFAGYVAGGLAGALAITAGMFLPAFAFSMIFFERLEALVDHPSLTRFLAGVGAAAVGIIAATFVDLAMATQLRISQPLIALALFLAALGIVWRFRSLWVIPATLAGAAVAGAVLPL